MNTISSLFKNLRNRTPVGSVEMYAGAIAPTDWLLCDGAAVSRETFSALFAVIGTTYGAGNGTTTFNLPDYRGRMPIGASNDYSLNASGGEVNHTLTPSETATKNHSHTMSHTHGTGDGSHPYFNVHSSGEWMRVERSGSDGYSRWQWFSERQRDDIGQVSATGGSSASNTGGQTEANGSPHNNMPPYRAINFIIYAGTTAS